MNNAYVTYKNLNLAKTNEALFFNNIYLLLSYILLAHTHTHTFKPTLFRAHNLQKTFHISKISSFQNRAIYSFCLSEYGIFPDTVFLAVYEKPRFYFTGYAKLFILFIC